MLQPQPANRLEHKSRANGRAVVRAIESFSLNLLSYLSFSFCKDKHILIKNKILAIFSAYILLSFADFIDPVPGMTFGTLSVTDLGAYFLFVNIFLFRHFTSYILSFLPFLLPLRVAIFTLRDYHFFLWGLPFFALGSVSFFHIAKLHILSRSCKLFRQISTQKAPSLLMLVDEYP